jgi:DNA helicase-2/ATP-dependent DNA helicase PcrA
MERRSLSGGASLISEKRDHAAFLRSLDTEQQEAVVSSHYPHLILGGAGSGKTRVLVYKTAWLIKKKSIPPDRIVFINYSRNIIDQILREINSIIPNDLKGLKIGTAYSLGVSFLKDEIHRIGFEKNIVIFDRHDQVQLIRQIMTDTGVLDDRLKPANIASSIATAKNQLITTKGFRISATTEEHEKIAFIFEKYQEKLAEMNAVDPEGVLLHLMNIYENYPEACEKIQSSISYIIVDEYQDLNRAEHAFIRALTSRDRKLFAAGDDDQAISSYKCASNEYIFDFQKEYPDARVTVLAKNYRSSGIISKSAKNLVAHNEKRIEIEKQMLPVNPDGEPIEIIEAQDERDEAVEVVKWIRDVAMKKLAKFSDILILFRTSSQAKPFEDALKRMVIPYKVTGNIKFYERKEIKDVLSYLRIITNPKDILAMKRIINIPRRGIGKTTIEKIEYFAQKKSIDFFEVLKRATSLPELSKNSRTKLEKFGSLILSFIEEKDSENAFELIKKVIDETGYIEDLRSQDLFDIEVRLVNIKKLLSTAEEFVKRQKNPNIENFLEEMALAEDVETSDETKDQVTMMQMTGIKGREFPFVIIAGLEDGLIPFSHAKENIEKMEEERRLFYVAMNRASKKLLFSYAMNRRRFHEKFSGSPSPFLKEIPEEYMVKRRVLKKEWNGIPEDHDEIFKASGESGDKIFPGEMPKYIVGEKVCHTEWGTGLIIDREGVGDELKVTVKFENGSSKKLLAKYAKLMKIPTEKKFSR